MSQESLRRFAAYSLDDLDALLREMEQFESLLRSVERLYGGTLRGLVTEIRAEAERRTHDGGQPDTAETLGKLRDIRPTGRLLEVLGDRVDAWDWMSGAEHNGFTEMREIVTELRRRGDALVWAADLRLVTELQSRQVVTESERAEVDAAWQRLENALGGSI